MFDRGIANPRIRPASLATTKDLAEITSKLVMKSYSVNIQLYYDFHSFAWHGLRKRIQKILRDETI